MDKLINITQLSKELNLINSKTNKPSNYILRYWEKEFKQIKPIIIRNRRYYTKKQRWYLQVGVTLIVCKGHSGIGGLARNCNKGRNSSRISLQKAHDFGFISHTSGGGFPAAGARKFPASSYTRFCTATCAACTAMPSSAERRSHRTRTPRCRGASSKTRVKVESTVIIFTVKV